jgi:serine/threonine-protein kinase HipA
MTFEVYVYAKLISTSQPIIAGVLGFSKDRIDFNYAKSWLSHPFRYAFHPELLPLTNAVFSSQELDGCLGVFRDSGPGIWGKEIIRKQYPNADQADFLILSNNLLRIGAFRYADNRDAVFNEFKDEINIDDVYEAIMAMEHGAPLTEQQARLLAQGSSMDGMRPKVFSKLDGKSWILKFPSKNDYDNKSVNEFIGMHLAYACGIDTPKVKLISVGKNKQAIAIERFDSEGGNIFPLMSAASAMGYADQESDKKDYRWFAQTLIRLSGKPEADCESLFRRMALNVMISNKDDHIYNQAMLLKSGKWQLSPVYDVVCGEGNRRNHAMSIGSQGGNGNLSNVLSSAGSFGFTETQAIEIINEMIDTVSGWKKIINDYLPYEEVKKIEWAILHQDIFQGYVNTSTLKL